MYNIMSIMLLLYRNKEGKKMYCEKCGTQIDDDSVFCQNCGEKQIDFNYKSDINIKTSRPKINKVNKSVKNGQ